MRKLIISVIPEMRGSSLLTDMDSSIKQHTLLKAAPRSYLIEGRTLICSMLWGQRGRFKSNPVVSDYLIK